MLQQILKDMYIDPDVLEALNEEQKKTLFLKMRQEQVRRWKEWEEKLEREGDNVESKRATPRKANSKRVSWLLGRDGDVSVLVIREVDELTSKFINSAFGDKKLPSILNNIYHQTILKSQVITQEGKSECQNVPSETQPGISLDLKEKREETSTLCPLPLQEKAPSPTEEKSVSQPPMCSRSPKRSNGIIVRPASANPTPGCISTRPGLKLAAFTPSFSSSSTVQLESASASTDKGSLCSEEPQTSQDSQAGKDIGTLEKFQRADSAKAVKSTACTGRGRVAHLMKTFNLDTPEMASSRGHKPPLPTKPDHLRLTTTPTVR